MHMAKNNIKNNQYLQRQYNFMLRDNIPQNMHTVGLPLYFVVDMVIIQIAKTIGSTSMSNWRRSDGLWYLSSYGFLLHWIILQDYFIGNGQIMSAAPMR